MTYYYKYLIMKNKYLKLKNKLKQQNIQNGGMGYYMTITNGYDSFRVSSFTQLVKLKKILKKKEGKEFFKVTKKIDKYLNSESYPNEFSAIVATNDETYKVILDVAKYLKIITY